MTERRENFSPVSPVSKASRVQAFDVPCSISVWLWDSRLKQTLIIPLVKHADKSAYSFVFFISNSSVLVYFGARKRMCRCALQLYNWYVLFLSTFQGEIGEKGQKVYTRFIRYHDYHDYHDFLFVTEKLGIWDCNFKAWQWNIVFVLCVQGEPGIGHRGPEGQAGSPGQKVKFSSFLTLKMFKKWQPK